MSKTFDISDFSEDELSRLIDEATSLRHTLRQSREHELPVAADGERGQDVRDPNHGVIPVPTPREVKEAAPTHGAVRQAG